MNVMTAPDVWSGQDRALTVEDMENMPDDEFRYELDDGVLIVSPAPSYLHQRVVFRLAQVLDAARPPEFEVVPGVGVNINRYQHRVPDVAVSYWIVDPAPEKPELIVFELRNGRYQQAARVAGDEEFQAALPFPVMVTPSALVRAGR